MEAVQEVLPVAGCTLRFFRGRSRRHIDLLRVTSALCTAPRGISRG